MTTEETIKQYQHLWNDKMLSGNDIAKLMGKTRSAVSGLINRARDAGWKFDRRMDGPIPKPTHPEKLPLRQARTRSSRPQPLPKMTPPPTKKRVAPKPIHGEITIVELEPYHCKAVMGRSKKTNMPTYCGQRRLEAGPYCQQHHTEYLSGYRR